MEAVYQIRVSPHTPCALHPKVKEGDSLGVKVEALRLFLERRLGVDRFLKV